VKEGLKPVFISALNTAAQPLPFLDYIIEAPERAAVINSDGILVNLPGPARFAFHKLIISRERAAAMQAKVEKDLAQAAALFGVLAEDRPGDILLAYEALTARGQFWSGKLKKALPVFAAKYPGGYKKLLSVIPKM
jgi:hypothetical protein